MNDYLAAYRRGAAASEAGVRVDGAVEANAAVAEARLWQRRLTNEALEQLWPPKEWGTLYEATLPRKITPEVELAARILRAKRRRK